MCGRYSNTKSLTHLVQQAGVALLEETWEPRYNIAPTQIAPVILLHNQTPELRYLRWGLIPSWSKDPCPSTALINARLETLSTLNSFRHAYKSRRCLVPADSYYEWQQRDNQRQPFRVMLQSREPFFLAGIWERWEPKTPVPPFNPEARDLPENTPRESFAIITTQANAALTPLHHRMPILVKPEDYLHWLEQDPDAPSSQDILRHPWDPPLKIYPVNTALNHARKDNPHCIEPITLVQELFETPWWETP